MAYLILFSILGFLYLVWRWATTEDRTFVHDRHNPYRRYCKCCGKQQDLYQHHNGAKTWEHMGMGDGCKACDPYDQSRELRF